MKADSENAVKTAVNLKSQANAVNMNVNAFRNMQYASARTGIEMSRMTSLITALDKVIEDASMGNWQYIDSLHKIGLSWKQLQSLSPEKQILTIVNAMNRMGVSQLPYSLQKAFGDKNANTLFDVKNGKWADAFASRVTKSTGLTLEQMTLANSLYADSIVNSDEMRNLENFEKHLNFLERREKILKKINSLKLSAIGGDRSLSYKIGAVTPDNRGYFKSDFTDIFNDLTKGRYLDTYQSQIYEQLAKMQFMMSTAKEYEDAQTILRQSGGQSTNAIYAWNKRRAKAFKEIESNSKNRDSLFFEREIMNMSKSIYSADLSRYDEYRYAHNNIADAYDSLRNIIMNYKYLTGTNNARYDVTPSKINRAEDMASALLNSQKEVLDKLESEYASINAQLQQQKSIQEQIKQIEAEKGDKVSEETKRELEKTQELQRQVKLKRMLHNLENETNNRAISNFTADLQSAGISTRASSDIISAYKGVFGDANTSKMLKNLDKQAYLKYVKDKNISIAGKTDEEVAASLMSQDLRKLDISYPRNSTCYFTEQK